MKFPRLPFREDKVFSLLVLLNLVVPLVFYWQLYEKFETVKLAFWALILGCALIAFLKQKKFTAPGFSATFLIFAFLIFGFFASCLSISPLTSFLGFYPRFTSGFLFYFLWAATLLLLIFTQEKPKWKFFVKLIFFDSVIIALSGILQSFGIGYYEGIAQAAISRAPGLLGNPNFSSMFLAAAIPFVLPLLKEAKNFAARVYYAVSVFFMFWAIVNFSSRGAFLALAAGLLFGLILLLFLRASKKTVLLVLLSIFISAGLMAIFSRVSRPGSIISALKFEESNIDLRLFSWDVARQAIVQHPFFGYGPGTLQIYFERFRGANLARQAGVFDDAHNVFLQMASTSGLPFALCFIGLIGLAFFRGYKKLRADREDWWTVSALAALVIWVLAACFNPVSTANFLLLAVILSGLYLNETFKEYAPYFLAKVLVFIISVGLIIFGLAFIASEAIYFEGYKSYLSQDFERSKNFISLAKKINPSNQNYYLFETADNIMLEPNSINLQKELEKLISLQPQSAKSQVMAANLSYLMFVRTNEKQYLKAAINYINTSLKMDRYFGPRYGRAAFYLAEDGQLSLARAYLKTGLIFDPANLPLWLLLGRIYQLEKMPSQMQYALNQAFKLNPENNYIKNLKLEAKNEKNYENLKIPAIINFYQIEP